MFLLRELVAAVVVIRRRRRWGTVAVGIVVDARTRLLHVDRLLNLWGGGGLHIDVRLLLCRRGLVLDRSGLRLVLLGLVLRLLGLWRVGLLDWSGVLG